MVGNVAKSVNCPAIVLLFVEPACTDSYIVKPKYAKALEPYVGVLLVVWMPTYNVMSAHFTAASDV